MATKRDSDRAEVVHGPVVFMAPPPHRVKRYRAALDRPADLMRKCVAYTAKRGSSLCSCVAVTDADTLPGEVKVEPLYSTGCSEDLPRASI